MKLVEMAGASQLLPSRPGMGLDRLSKAFLDDRAKYQHSRHRAAMRTAGMPLGLPSTQAAMTEGFPRVKDTSG